jgi:hypothetical protein
MGGLESRRVYYYIVGSDGRIRVSQKMGKDKGEMEKG